MSLAETERRLGYAFKNKRLLERALTLPSLEFSS